MLRVFLLILLNLSFLSGLIAQVKKFYSLENGDYKRVIIHLKATSNSCSIKPTVNPYLVNLFGFDDNLTPEIYTTEDVNNTRNLMINLNNEHGQAGASLSQKFFNVSNGNHQDHWDLYLSREKPMQLLLNYAIGDAYVDLSSLPIEKLKITTGSANVQVEYLDGRSNLVEMDTFFVKVDLGSLTINRINYARARSVIADVSFGALLMDYSDLLKCPSDVYASVGAGNLIIGLPSSDQIPIIININNSPLCHVNLPRQFKKMDKHIYVNDMYSYNAPNLLTFNLDVAVGQIKFVESK